MDNGKELINALDELEKLRGISKDIVLEALETSLVTACKKNFGNQQNVKVVINRENGSVKVFAQKQVVEVVEDEVVEISFDNAKEINISYDLGDIVDVEVTPRDFGRISAQSAKQIVMQKIREAERGITLKKLQAKENEVFSALVQRRDKKNIIVTIDDIEAVLTPQDQTPNESFKLNERILVYVTQVKQMSKATIVNVSRATPELVRRLFEQNVPEIYDGTVEIMSIAREAGSRTKIAVFSNDEKVDAVGACVGPNGLRVATIVNELKGEKIDIINWSKNPLDFIVESLNPSKVTKVMIDENNRTARAVVPDNQLSLAIGKNGQNVRLAVKLTGWKIDIKSESQDAETSFLADNILGFGKKRVSFDEIDFKD